MDAKSENEIVSTWLQFFDDPRISETTIFFIPSDIEKFNKITDQRDKFSRKIDLSEYLSRQLGGGFDTELIIQPAIKTFMLSSSNILPEEERSFKVMEDHLMMSSVKITFTGEPFLVFHEKRQVNVIVQYIYGMILSPQLKQVLGMGKNRYNDKSFVNDIIGRRFPSYQLVPKNPQSRVFFALDMSKIQEFCKEFNFPIKWNAKMFENLTQFENMVPIDVRDIMLMSPEDMGVDPDDINGIKFKARDGKVTWIFDAKRYMKNEYGADRPSLIVYFVDRMPTLVLKEIESRLKNLKNQRSIATLGKDVFREITNGKLRGKDLIRACNTSRQVNSYCNADNQDVFRKAIAKEFKLELPEDISEVTEFSNARELYMQLHTFFIWVIVTKWTEDGITLALVENGMIPEGVLPLDNNKTNIIIISREDSIHYDGGQFDGKMYYIEVAEHPNFGFVFKVSDHISRFYGINPFSKVEGFQKEWFKEYITRQLDSSPSVTFLMFVKFGDETYTMRVYPINNVLF